MKRILTLLILLAILPACLWGCDTARPAEPSKGGEESSHETVTYPKGEETSVEAESHPKGEETSAEAENHPTEEPLPSISLRSMAELDELREMCSCTDEEVLQAYLWGIEGAGARNREDLQIFLSVVESLPVPELLSGEITWICYDNIYPDISTTENGVVFLSTQGENGDWTRIGYYVCEKDVPAALQAREEKGYFAESVIQEPFESRDGRIVVYAEMIREHPSGTGSTVTWMMTVDGILAEMVYYSKDVSGIRGETVLKTPVIGSLKKA